MTVSDAFQQAFSSAENKISDEMTGIVRSDQLKTHTMTVIKSNHGGVMSLANNFDGFNERTLNEDLSSNGNALAPLNSNQLAELNNQPQLSQKCNNANDGDAIKSQEKQDEKGYRNDPTSQKKEKYGFATRRILENQDDELFPSFPDRPNTARFINENAAFSSASIPQNHRQSRVHSRKRNYERESATREIEIGPNDRQTKLEERLRLAKEATQRSAMIEKAREEQIAVKEARLRKNREENNIKRKEQEHREQQEQQKQQQIEQQKLQEQRLKAQKTIIVEPDEFILEEVNPHAPGSDLFNTATLTNLEDVQIIEGGFEEIDESRFVYMPEQQIQDYAGPSHIQPQSLIYDHSTFEIQGIPAELNKDSQNVTVIEEVEDEPAWKNDGLIKTQIMQEAFAWTEKANKFSTRKTIPREKLREERYSSQTDFAFMAFMRHVITHAMKSFNYPRMNSNNMLLWDLARDLKQSEDDKHEKFKENMKIMSKLLSMSNGKHQNTIFTDLVMFVQEKFKNGGKLEREAFFDEMTVQQKEEAKNRRARKVVKPGKVKKRGAKKLGRPRKNKSKISIAQEDQTASLNAQTPQ
ncbi:unnamed protein product [Oikopleura dioica]|uniref:Uncharacterized protein n=1 Tax=Oikopleura dioica TaxID=34765 RepID=E4XRR2_OIKDI|nr:unnamed protein product [Oikopleura dioica]